MTVPRDDCREWRLLASCELDGELSEFGSARLRGHLAGCAECARWAAETRSVAELLRVAEPAPVEREIYLPALRRRLSHARGLLGAGASAAAAALAAALIGLPSGTVPGTSSLPGARAPFASGSGCIACTESHIVLTTFRRALITPRPNGMQNPSVKIE